MISTYPDETLRMRGINLNLCVLRMLEDTFSLGEAHFMKANIFSGASDEVCMSHSCVLSGKICFSKHKKLTSFHT